MLKDIVDADYDGHERFGNPAEMLQMYRKYYGEKVVPETIVKIIKFELL